MSTLRFIIFSLAVIIQSGCVEHSLKLTVLSENKLNIDYTMQGDRIDMEDGLEHIPDSTIWNSSRSIKENDDETIHIFKSSLLLDSLELLSEALDWSKNSPDSVYLFKKAKVNVNEYFFLKIYTFYGYFQSRNFTHKYGDIWDYIPLECKVLENDNTVDAMTSSEVEILEKKYALGLIQWNRARYEQRFHKVWKIMKHKLADLRSIPQSSFSIAFSGWKDDIRQHLNSIDADNPDLLALEWWEDLRPQFLGHFVDLLGMENISLVEQVSESIDKDYRISRDLDDEQFELELILPGIALNSDGTKQDDGSLIWKFSGKELMDGDIDMHSQSIQLAYWNISLSIFGLLILGGFVVVKRKRAGN